MRMINLLTRVGWETRAALHARGGAGQADRGRLEPAAPGRETGSSALRATAKELVDYLRDTKKDLPGYFIHQAPS